MIRTRSSQFDLKSVELKEKRRKKKEIRDKDFVDKWPAQSDIPKIPTKKLVEQKGCI